MASFWARFVSDGEDPEDINSNTKEEALSSDRIDDAYDEAKEKHGENLRGLLWDAEKKKSKPGWGWDGW
jgi:hypothetical protein